MQASRTKTTAPAADNQYPALDLFGINMEGFEKNEPPPAIAPIGGDDECPFEPLLLVLTAPVEVMVDVLPSWVITDVMVLARPGVGKTEPKGVVLITPSPAVSVAPLVCRSPSFSTTHPHHED